MPIPDFQSIFLPLLNYLKDDKEHSLRDAIDDLGSEFHLSEKELRELLPSGSQAVFNNRVGWARTYLKKAGLIETTKRGFFKITKRGLNVLEEKPEKLDSRFLMKYPEFVEFQKTTKKEKVKKRIHSNGNSNNETPEEIIENAFQKVYKNLALEILQIMKSGSPSFFEKIVVDLLLKMGYGGSKKDAGKAIGKSGDGGIDGIIKEDKLGLDIVYIQAKRWEGVVGRPEIQKFAGALIGNKARKGVFITTSTFSKDAKVYVSHIDSKIILIDGEQLAQYMIDHNVGVSTVSLYEIKKIDYDYFEEE
jgi:restriction system protein